MTPSSDSSVTRCKTCGLTRYEHQDHAHDPLKGAHGTCPFGDCGAFVPAPAPSTDPVSGATQRVFETHPNSAPPVAPALPSIEAAPSRKVVIPAEVYHVGVTLTEEIEARGTTPERLADAMGVPRDRRSKTRRTLRTWRTGFAPVGHLRSASGCCARR